ncbi:alpha/beta hydrolase [Mycolicibacterium alvei]|uniref:Alpha/beta hydrolase n=1 Tax=Mycolicibacterium alvei TaxID=67081 RepID=A0A6N4UVR0_9MYCO|nr:alpha/beta fold hydrolase [Mycolicibacterium alvei]MCV6999603.1 alpha/beta fold hydrolase [Mycolicibacterium alvei]BBX28518.1 alpha/beta hydrolase [Mycolicibacterium alvei]
MTERLDVRFPSGGVECSGWLYLPAGGPAPVIVMAHGLGAVRGMRLDAYAERFCAAGYACLVFDYRHFGDSDGQPRQLLDIGRQLDDWAAAIAYARSLKEVDSSRVVLWGSSFGGGHVIAAAARDGNITAVVSQCPFTDGPASVLAMPPLASAKVTALALRDAIGARFGQAPVMVATAGPPGSTALMSAPDAEPGYLALVPATAPFSNEVAARIALGITFYIPGRKAAQVACPILFCICESDSVAPAKAALRHARKAPRGEIKLYPEGHFDIYVGDAFERIIADQIQFLNTHVAPS